MNDPRKGIATQARHKGFSIQAHLVDLGAPLHTSTIANLSLLENTLAMYNVPLRDDSRLAFLWATGQLDETWNLAEASHEMMSVQFICTNTSYNDMAQPFMRALAEQMRARYGLQSWNTVWRIVREYAPDILKIICLIEAGLNVPNFTTHHGVMVPLPASGNLNTGDTCTETIKTT